MSGKRLKGSGKKWLFAAVGVLSLLALRLYVRWPGAVTAGTVCVLCMLALGIGRERLLLRFAPRFMADQRLKRFLRSGKKIRVVCFGRPEEGEEPGFHLAFDGTPRQGSGLAVLLFSEIEPRSLAENAAAFLGKTAEGYCCLDSQTGVQLTGTLEAEDGGLRLSVRSVKLSGRAEPVFIHGKSGP